MDRTRMPRDEGLPLRELLEAARALRAALPEPPALDAQEREEYAPDSYDLLVTHRELREVTRQLFLDRHYARAVEEAFKALIALVRRRSGLATDGVPLVEQAFSAQAPRLRVNRMRTQSERDQQAGYSFLLRGAVLGIRNPRAHDHLLTDERDEALEMLTLANHLFNVVTSATRTRVRRR